MTETAGPDGDWHPERDPGVQAAWHAGLAAGRQSVFADLQAAYDRAHDVGYGANTATASRREVQAGMLDTGRGPGHRALADALAAGFADGTRARKQVIASIQARDLDRARAAREQQASLGEPDAPAAPGKPEPVTDPDPDRAARWETWAESRRAGRQAQPEREAEPG